MATPPATPPTDPALAALTEEAIESAAELRQALDPLKTLNKHFGDLIEKLGIVTELNRTASGKIAKDLASLSKQVEDSMAGLGATKMGGMAADMQVLSKAMGAFGETMRDSIAALPFQALDNLFKKSIDLAMQIEKMEASFTKQTGIVLNKTNEAEQALTNVAYNLSAVGVGAENAEKALLAYQKATLDGTRFTAGFSSELNQAIANEYIYYDTTERLADRTLSMAATFETLGVSSESLFTIANNMQGVAGIGYDNISDGITKITEDSIAFTKAGLPIKTLTEDMTKFGDVVAIQGANASKVFLQLELQAKMTGIAVDSLVGLANKFDTFESAAEQVGKLNALLGGDFLSTTDMLMETNPAERLRSISDAISSGGLGIEQLEQMDEATRKYTLTTLQSTLGFKDLTETQNFLKMSETERLAQAKEMEDAAAKEMQMQKDQKQVLADLTVLARDAIPVMEKFFKSLDAFFTAFQPLATAFLNFFESLGNGITEFGAFIGGLGEVGKTIVALIELIALLGLAMLSYKLFIQPAVIATKGLAEAATLAGKSAADAAKAAAGGPGGAGGGPSTGLIERIIGKATPQQMIGLAIVIASIGASIYLAAIGIAELVKSFKGLTGDEISGALKAITILLVGFVAILVVVAVAMYALGPAAAAAVPFAAVIFAIGAAVGLAAWGMSKLVEAAGNMFKALSPEQLGAIAKFGFTMSGLAVAGPLAAIGMASIATGIVAIRTALFGMDIENWKVATNFFIAVAAAKGVSFSGLAAEIGKLTDTEFKVSQSSPTTQQPKKVELVINQPIYLYINDNLQLEAFVKDTIDATLSEYGVR